ncbi:MAG TPA: SWIM zinc finger family protein, partial [Bryobacteraceae bacterium]|nr:SWIM zinc finger family protein [Bryobacteraceae bacterium]
MSISSHLARHFSAGVRQRGQGYFGGGQVRMLHGSATDFEARVRGSETYEVMLEVRGSALRLHCDCAHFETGEPCKHIWAAILAAEKLRYLSAAASVTTVLTQPIFTGPEAEFTGGASVYPPMPQWRTRLNELIQTVPERSGGAVWRWPAHRQILYIIDRSGIGENGTLSLGLYVRDRRADGNWGRIAPLNLRRIDIPRLPDAADHPILAAIAGAMMTYNYAWAGQNQVPGSAMVDVPLARFVIPAAARAGRLFLRDKTSSREITPISWNERPWAFTLEVERNAGLWRLQGLLRRSEES